MEQNTKQPQPAASPPHSEASETVTLILRKEVNAMAWYDEAVFYHIYPLGLTGAPKENDYGEPVHRLLTLLPWIEHIRSIGCNALYIGPLFESVGHGYETTDYKKLDSRLGTNEDLKTFVKTCHEAGLKVIFDGVFNHTGRDFFAFKDIRENRENSAYKDWYCNVNFWNNNEYNDGFSYDNWGGYNLLAKLNQWNGDVRAYICDVIRFWVSEFDVDGIRLDAADVLDFEYMKAIRSTANEVKPDFYLMGEVIHGDYTRWVNGDMLHAVTNYALHKALYSGHNDHNYFEIAHTVKRLYDMGGGHTQGLRLYNFVDNHDVERIYTKLSNKNHFIPVHILLYTLPGVPSIYYGSEFGIEGQKYRGGSDDAIRPALNLSDFADALETKPGTAVIARLGQIRQQNKALSYGGYEQLILTNRQYVFARGLDTETVYTAVNNDENETTLTFGVAPGQYEGALSGRTYDASSGQLQITIPGCSGEVLLPIHEGIHEGNTDYSAQPSAAETDAENAAEENADDTESAGSKSDLWEALNQAASEAAAQEKLQTSAEAAAQDKDAPAEKGSAAAEAVAASEVVLAPAGTPYEEMTVPQLQAAILQRMAQNGPVTDQMKRDVMENIWHDSLVNWIKSFR